jgi:hypothetical protein
MHITRFPDFALFEEPIGSNRTYRSGSKEVGTRSRPQRVGTGTGLGGSKPGPDLESRDSIRGLISL